MTPFFRRITTRFLSSRKAASLMEFGVVVGLISLVGFGSVVATGGEVRTIFCQVTKSVEESVFGDDSRVCRVVVADGGGQGGGGDGGGQGGGGGGQGGGGEPPPVTPDGDARYPQSVVVGGINYLWHVHANHPIGVMPLGPSEPALVTFANPLIGGQWDIAVRNMTAQPGTVVLEYNASGTWTPAASLPLGANAQVAQVVPFTPVEAASWRVRVEGTSSVSVVESRIGTAADLPPLLPVLGLDATYAFTLNALETFDLAPSVLNAEPGLVFEFDRTSWNGITFSAAGVMEGIGTSVVASPGTPMQVRVRDSRNIWSDWFDFTSVIATDATADTRYPVVGASWPLHYSQGASESVVLAPGEASEFGFDQVVSVNAWSVLARRESGSFGSSLDLQYQDSLGAWTSVEGFSLQSADGSNPVARAYTFDTVVAQNFRIVNMSSAGRSIRLMEGRVGFDEVYPAYLPHIASSLDIDIPVIATSTVDLASSVVNAVGPLEFEFTPATRNGLSYNSDGTITGLPEASVGTPGDTTTFRFRDSRGLWSRTYTMRVTSSGELVASAVYPVSGTHLADQYGASAKRNVIAANGGTHLLTFSRPIRVTDWEVGIDAGNASVDVGVALQYLNAQNVWVGLDSVVQSRFAISVSLFNESFAEVSAQQFRVINTSNRTIEVTRNRLGHGGAFPAFLPHVPVTTRTAEVGSPFTGTYASAVANAVGPVEFEFTPSTWNGLTFASDGTVSGTPTEVASSPGQAISVRLRDSRGVWSSPTDVRMIVSGTVFASNSYPEGGAEALDYYTGGTINISLPTNASHLVTFPVPTTVTSWTATVNLGGTGNQRLVLQYRDSGGVWRDAAQDTKAQSSSALFGGVLPSVTATEFRLNNPSTGGGHIVRAFRLGHNGVFPADLPRLTGSSTVTIPFGVAANFDLDSLFSNLSGDTTYEFSSTSWNGLSFNSDGTITGTPTVDMPAPGQPFTMRVKDGRNAWSKVYSFRMVVSGGASASSSYPVSGSAANIPVLFYSNIDSLFQMNNNAGESIAFAAPVTVDSWELDAGVTNSFGGLRLEYRTGPSTWATATTINMPTGTRTTRSATFAAVTASEFRFVPTHTGRTYFIYSNRLGVGGNYPAFLPHFASTTVVTTTIGELTSDSLASLVSNAVGPVSLEFSESSYAGLEFDVDGTIRGRPNRVEATPGRLVDVRVRDSRNVYSRSSSFRLVIHADVAASSVYPTTSAQVLEDYTDDGGSANLSNGNSRTYTFAQPVYVDSWSIRHASNAASYSAFTLQYQNPTGSWINLATAERSVTSFDTSVRTFTGVTATSFRIVAVNGTRVETSRLGAGGVFPGFLPHFPSGLTFTTSTGTPTAFDLASQVVNAQGPVSFTFGTPSVNGLALNASGTIVGTPTAATVSPGQSVTLTMTDSRGITSSSYPVTVMVQSIVPASTVYPSGGTAPIVAHYTQADAVSTLTDNTSQTYVFSEPVLVSSWAINFAPTFSGYSQITFQYRDNAGTWRAPNAGAFVPNSTTTFQTSERTFPQLTATEFRITYSGGSTGRINHSRIGLGGAYPAFYP